MIAKRKDNKITDSVCRKDLEVVDKVPRETYPIVYNKITVEILRAKYGS